MASLNHTFKELEMESDYEGLQVDITRNKNDWKHEIVISKNNMRLIRLKIYCKTAFLLTACGVSNKNIHDPLWKLLLTFDRNGYN